MCVCVCVCGLYTHFVESILKLAQLAGVVEYFYCISAEDYDTSNEYPRYNTDVEALVNMELWEY